MHAYTHILNHCIHDVLPHVYELSTFFSPLFLCLFFCYEPRPKLKLCLPFAYQCVQICVWPFCLRAFGNLEFESFYTRLNCRARAYTLDPFTICALQLSGQTRILTRRATHTESVLSTTSILHVAQASRARRAARRQVRMIGAMCARGRASVCLICAGVALYTH
jgi:hypothetical protein